MFKFGFLNIKLSQMSWSNEDSWSIERHLLFWIFLLRMSLALILRTFEEISPRNLDFLAKSTFSLTFSISLLWIPIHFISSSLVSIRGESELWERLLLFVELFLFEFELSEEAFEHLNLILFPSNLYPGLILLSFTEISSSLYCFYITNGKLRTIEIKCKICWIFIKLFIDKQYSIFWFIFYQKIIDCS